MAFLICEGKPQITVVFISVMIIYISCVYGGIQRTATWRTGFMELGRFPDCGVNATPVAEHTAFTQSLCSIHCLEDTRCVSYEYITENKTCFLHDVSAIENLMAKDGYTYADSSDPVQVGEIHPCEESYCSEGNVCVEECSPNGFVCECPEGYYGRFCDKLIPVDGGFTPWGPWTDCNEVCMATRYRNCTNPVRVGAGADCVGPNTGVKTCSTRNCQVYPYMGCFHQSDFDSKGLQSVLTTINMTLDLCVDQCSNLGYQYAAIQNDECKCRRHDPLPKIPDELECSTSCPGNENQTCGDVNKYVSVYATGTFYQGCFTGNVSKALLIIAPTEMSDSVHTTASMTTVLTTMDQTTTSEQTTHRTTVQADEHTTLQNAKQTTSNNTYNDNVTNSVNENQSTMRNDDVATTTEGPPTTEDITTQHPTTTNSQTTAEPPTEPPHLTLTVADCISGCEDRGYLYAWLFNASYCLCQDTLRDLERSSSGCNAPCPGGDGLVCGGDSTISVYQINPHDISHWTAWYNNHYPFVDGNDYEDPEEIRAAEPWICDEPTDVQCRDFITEMTNEQLGDIFETPCSVDEGFNCTAEMQTYYVNVTFEVTNYRIVDVQTEANLTELNCTFTKQEFDTTTAAASFENGTVPHTFQMYNQTSNIATEATNEGQTYEGQTSPPSITFDSTTSSTAHYSTVHPDDLLSMECRNVTVSRLENVQVNESYITFGWRIDAVVKNCQDYKIRFLCPIARGKLVGCYYEGSLNEFIANTTMEINPENCTRFCRDIGYRYAAVQSSKAECACGNVYADDTALFQSCSTRCGDNNYPCGGLDAQSVYFSDCDMPFNLDNTSMRGTPMHFNEGHHEYETWFGGFNDNTTTYLQNFTNLGQQLSFDVSVDLGEVRPVTKLLTSGMFVEGIDAMTGTTSFRVAYKVFEDDELIFIKSSSLEARIFTVKDLWTKTEHVLGNVVELQYLEIFVDSYDRFPGILLDVHGCAN
ncbi:uncharacterized protein [Apostichopus japonicus]|uniref:uncharacterized protein n=1 Tax=Stichopus japonicus TaxID=307972 RepID=UPI003AB2908C